MGRIETAEWRASTAGSLRIDVLGLSLQIRCDGSATLAAVEAKLGGWRAPARGRPGPCLELEIRIGGPAGGGSVRYQASPSRLVISGGVQGWADVALRRAVCRVPCDWAASDRLFEEAVEPLLLFLICHADRTPIHASACIIDGIAMVLSGPSGSGKSCLAYAAKRAGLPVLSDDTVHVQLRGGLQLWGMSRPIHVFPADARGHGPRALRWRNGKLKAAIPQDGDRARQARRAVLCVLDRGDAVALELVRGASPTLPPLEPGFDLLPAQSLAACSALTARGFARLTLSGDPDEAISMLRRHRVALAQIAAG